MNKDSTHKSLNYLGLTLSLLWPFWSMVYGLFLNRKFAFKGLLALFCFYGFTLNVTQESDISRYIEQFKYYSNAKESNLFTEYISGYHSDFYLISMIFLVKSVTSNSNIYLAILTFVYSYFYLSSIYLVLNRITKRNTSIITIFEIIIIFVVFFYVPIFFINGIRFYTALYFYVYCVLNFIIGKNKRIKYFVFLTPLIHISFIIVVFIFLLYLVIGKNRSACLIVLVLSIFLPNFISWNLENVTAVEGVAVKKINNYTKTELKEGFFENVEDIHYNASVKWRIYNIINTSHFYMVLIVFMLLISKPKQRKYIDFISPNFINFHILILALCFFARDIPESYRFHHLFTVSFLFSVIYIYKSNELSVDFISNKYLNLLVYSLLPYTISICYLYTSTVSWKVLISNWFIELLWF